ncbi:protein ANTI-SILENCING 1 [Abrus precatorius]|uniref:Protein ANTI-SILENCING 1 n=1 Tax=Abrus precatorius TaxID=3816 RepID=A0A8B8KI41_ABRPR|nr:protein ANTI-SILENCING 1 [Abrus precatorius]
MSHSSEENVGEFKWGNKREVGGENKDVRYYESFVFENKEYFLHDCAFFHPTGLVETSIGKIVNLFETSTCQKMARVIWFLRPAEIRKFFGDYKPCWNELFLASGGGKAVSNDFPLEAILGNCSIVCTSKDKRNPEPSETELKMANYFFSYTFDVDRRVISDKFPDVIGGVKVELFFNRERDIKPSTHLHVGTNIRPKIEIKNKNDPSTILHCQVNDKAEVRTSENVLPKGSSHSFPYKKRKIVEEKSTIGQSSKTLKEEETDEKKLQVSQDKRVKTYKNVIVVTERPNAPWDDRLQKAQELDSLILLNNLDPSYTSHEVENLVWHALNEQVEARMIERSLTSNTYCGRALVIFKTKKAAESAISELNKRCLILGGGRIVCATKETLSEPVKRGKFTGHLVFDRTALHKQRQEIRNAVSTSHCSQPNTIEYEMATEWLLQYLKSNYQWNALYKKQMKEIQDVKSKLKMDRIFCADS